MVITTTSICSCADAAHSSQSDDSSPRCFSCCMVADVHPKMLQVQSWASTNYRIGFSISVEKLNKLHTSGNVQGYMQHFSFTVGRFLDPNKPHYVNPPTKKLLLSTIQEITEVNNAYVVEELKEKRRIEISRKRLAKQKSNRKCSTTSTSSTSER